MIGLTSSILPAIFGKTITVSPMLLFAIIIVSNLPHYIKSKIKIQMKMKMKMMEHFLVVNFS